MSIGSMLVRHAPESAAVVRHEIADDLRLQGVPPHCIEDVVLVVTELVGNAIVHSATGEDDLGIAWDVEPGAVTVRVEDHSESLPQPRHAAQHSKSGRGLAIVAALSREWGVVQAPGGKQVWACVPVQSPVLHRKTA